jgi:serine protease Do
MAGRSTERSVEGIEAFRAAVRPRNVALLLLTLGLLSAPGVGSAGDPFLRHTVTVQVVKEVGPAVVNITTEQKVRRRASPFAGDPFFDSFFRDFFEPSFPDTAENLGSGVVIDAEGHILTNEHVVARASRIQVALADGRELDAKLIGADPKNDVAVLKVESEQPLPWIGMGTSEDLMVGEPVIAIGNPFGLSSTVTTGVISALNRSLRSEQRVYHGFLQTDASINPGNSGGPLLNAEGELVGINTAVYQGAQGIGFAIPIDTAARVVRELIEEGEVSPVWLGVEFQDLTPELVQAMGLDASVRGALVNRVRKESPAKQAGIERGDVITHLDGRPISGARTFFEMLETAVDGQELRLTVLREERSRKIAVRAEEVPEPVIEALVLDLLGMELAPGARGGFEVRSVRRGSGAERIGIQAGDVVLGINGRTLVDADALRRSALDLRGRTRAQVVVQRGGGRYHVTVPLV